MNPPLLLPSSHVSTSGNPIPFVFLSSGVGHTEKNTCTSGRRANPHHKFHGGYPTGSTGQQDICPRLFLCLVSIASSSSPCCADSTADSGGLIFAGDFAHARPPLLAPNLLELPRAYARAARRATLLEPPRAGARVAARPPCLSCHAPVREPPSGHATRATARPQARCRRRPRA